MHIETGRSPAGDDKPQGGRVVCDTKGIAAALDVSESFVRRDRTGKRLLPFFRIGDLIRYDLDRVLAALQASEEGGPRKATRKARRGTK